MKRIAAAVTLALATPLALSGCAAPEAFEEAIPPALVSSEPLIEDAFVGVSTGVSGQGVHVRIYVSSVEHHDLVRVVDGAFATILAASPRRPLSIAVSLDEAPMPPEPTIGWGNVDIGEVARELGLGGKISNDVISGPTQFFEERYGTWEELHGQWQQEHQ